MPRFAASAFGNLTRLVLECVQCVCVCLCFSMSESATQRLTLWVVKCSWSVVIGEVPGYNAAEYSSINLYCTAVLFLHFNVLFLVAE